MSRAGAIFLISGALEVTILGALAVIMMVAGAWVFLRSRQTAAQRERKRRLAIHLNGRMGDATIIDVRDCILFYSYEVRGVAYATSQDATEFRHLLPPETSILGCPVGMKYVSNNPANSIVICEEWSGLRQPAPQIQATRAKESSHS
jgi:hypothetical protein